MCCCNKFLGYACIFCVNIKTVLLSHLYKCTAVIEDIFYHTYLCKYSYSQRKLHRKKRSYAVMCDIIFCFIQSTKSLWNMRMHYTVLFIYFFFFGKNCAFHNLTEGEIRRENINNFTCLIFRRQKTHPLFGCINVCCKMYPYV